MKRSLLLLSILILAFASCEKDKDDDSCTLSSANLAGNYKVTSVIYKASATSPEIDVFALYAEECSKDDITAFNDNGTMNYIDAGSACDPEGSYNGSWSLTGDTITADGTAGTVENFSCNGFSISESDASTGEKATITYARQ